MISRQTFFPPLSLTRRSCGTDAFVTSRYLRARRWVPEDALKQFRETHEWREANDIDTLYHTIEVSSYEQSRRMVRSLSP